MNEQMQEVLALTNRWVKRLSREKFSMLFTLIQPMLFWLIFFGNLFQRAADVQVVQAPNYMSFLAAGVVVMTVLNNGLAGGVDLLFDKENGFLERLMATPIKRSSVILSRFPLCHGHHRDANPCHLGSRVSLWGQCRNWHSRHCGYPHDWYVIWHWADRYFYGYGLFRQKPWRFLLRVRLSISPYDFSQFSLSAFNSYARLDASFGFL